MNNWPTDRKAAANTRLAQWGLTWFIESLCFYCKFVLADSLVFQNPPLRQAWERCGKIRSAPIATSVRRITSADVARRYANFAHL